MTSTPVHDTRRAPSAPAAHHIPQDASGVIGIMAPGEESARLAYFGLYALQHRGQESAGIAVSNTEQILVYKDTGLISQVFDDQALGTLEGQLAIGNVHHAPDGAHGWESAQPTLGPGRQGSVALVHNGNLVNSDELFNALQARPEARNGELARGARTDTAIITAMLGTPSDGASTTSSTSSGTSVSPGTSTGPDTGTAAEPMSEQEAAARTVLPQLGGAFALVFMDEHTLYAARDPHGIRPLVLGRLPSGWAVASETPALDIIGATPIRDVEPGELLVIGPGGMRSHQFASPQPRGCIFEYVYLSRPDAELAERSVDSVRTEMGRVLAGEHPAAADLVIATPESGTPAAIGYAQASGIPFGRGLVKNSYVGRTFIRPTDSIRQRGIRIKLNPLRDAVSGTRIVVVDDSIVRGNTQRAVVAMLREAGAAEVHVRISSPPVRWPCHYGIDFATRTELVANGLTIAELCDMLGADSLGYISEAGMVAATALGKENVCTACFSGDYPVPPNGDEAESGSATDTSARGTAASEAAAPDAAPGTATPDTAAPGAQPRIPPQHQRDEQT